MAAFSKAGAGVHTLQWSHGPTRLKTVQRGMPIAMLLCIVILTALGSGDGFAVGQTFPGLIPSAPSLSGEPADKAKPFAPGVRIDWQRRLVEVDVEVVLRDGALELLACSPRTREHESILTVRARPMHVFQAMGLIGLKPGTPVRYDQSQDLQMAPTGEALDLKVSCGKGKEKRVRPVERWLLDVRRGRPPEKLNWVFAGSRNFQDGRFAADVDGTIVCVVDFESALISLGALHSADTELLWLAANTEEIPPIGTPCTLLIRSAAGRRLVVDVADDATLRRNGTAVSAADLARAVGRLGGESAAVTIMLRHGAKVPAKTMQTAVDSLVRAGIARAVITILEPAAKHETGKPDE